MDRKLIDIKFTDEYKGVKKGTFFEVPCKFFGREGTQLYKIFGFENDVVYAQRLNKRTMKMPNNAPILESFNFNTIFPN